MQITGLGSMSYMPQIYNTNAISRSSMNRIAPISEDVTRSKVNFNGLLSDENQNTNPLKRGESADFAEILASQFSMSARQQARVVAPTQDGQGAGALAAGVTTATENGPDQQMNRALEAYRNSFSGESSFYGIA